MNYLDLLPYLIYKRLFTLFPDFCYWFLVTWNSRTVPRSQNELLSVSSISVIIKRSSEQGVGYQITSIKIKRFDCCEFLLIFLWNFYSRLGNKTLIPWLLGKQSISCSSGGATVSQGLSPHTSGQQFDIEFPGFFFFSWSCCCMHLSHNENENAHTFIVVQCSN